MSDPLRTAPRLVATLLISAAAAVLAVPIAQSATSARPAVRTATWDQYRSQQWTLGALHIPRSWRLSRGNGVTVAVLDTGVDGHQPDLVGRVVVGPDFTGHARRPGSRYWGRHGTEMASIIAGHGHGPGGGAGVMGVAPEAEILSIRVTWELTDPDRSDDAKVEHARDAIAQGIRYAADHGAQVISMSLGGGKLFYNGDPLEEAAVKYALSKGVVLVASAGNDGNGANRRNYPAAYPGVIAVGAVDRSFKPARFTNRHTYVSVAAPGVEIVSADVTGHGYVLGTGTSSSAAFVAGIAALIKARYPNLTPDEVKQAIELGTTHRPPEGRTPEIGTGVADALGALRAAKRINNAEHGGAGVQKPQPTTAPAPSPAEHGPDLVLVAVLSGGGTLLVLSVIFGWRQRRRNADVAAAMPVDTPATDDEPIFDEPAGRSPRRRRPVDESPWRPRPTDDSWDPLAENAAWQPPRSSRKPKPVVPGPLAPYEPPRQPAGTNGNGNGNGSRGRFPSLTQDFRITDDPGPGKYGVGLSGTEGFGPSGTEGFGSSRLGERRDPRTSGPNPTRDGPDPLSDDPIEPSPDIGTPLAAQSWESIRREFDRLKDTGNWTIPPIDDGVDVGLNEGLNEGLDKSTDEDPGGAQAESGRPATSGTTDETINMPIVRPEDDET